MFVFGKMSFFSWLELLWWANEISLRKGRENFNAFGACHPDMIPDVRKPLKNEITVAKREKKKTLSTINSTKIHKETKSSHFPK